MVNSFVTDGGVLYLNFLLFPVSFILVSKELTAERKETGGRYSSESVYRVFKDALLKAGIYKDVGVHSLRHSYATHLHESGLDIRYIQELLGHKSSRTTEIYTHVSRQNLILVRSPIEDMDVK